jgi:hypothetical protein
MLREVLNPLLQMTFFKVLQARLILDLDTLLYGPGQWCSFLFADYNNGLKSVVTIFSALPWFVAHETFLIVQFCFGSIRTIRYMLQLFAKPE